LDKETNLPVPYASVYLSSLKSGVYSSEAGLFKLKYDSPNDTLVVSVVGYSVFKTQRL
jgi:hypothetical protein